MTLWALEIEYDGTPFMGWQRQKHGLAIQQVVEEAGAKLRGGGDVSEAVSSGRTDAGVHAIAQIVQIELPDHLAPFRIREAMNFHLKPHPIVVLRCCIAPEGWQCAFLRRLAQLSLHHLQPGRAAGAGLEPGLARAPETRCGSNAPGSADIARPS